jgi:hypothetical protein
MLEDDIPSLDVPQRVQAPANRGEGIRVRGAEEKDTKAQDLRRLRLGGDRRDEEPEGTNEQGAAVHY